MDDLRAIARREGAFLVEDAAQAMGGNLHGQPLGTLGDVGFFSLGRGKMLTCGEGGIVLTDSSEIGEMLAHNISALPGESRRQVARNLLVLCAQCAFTHPSLYWLPDGVPALGLGRTIYPGKFPITRLPDAHAAILTGWAPLLAETACTHRRNAQRLAALLHENGWSTTRQSTDTPYLRLPVLLGHPEHKARLCALSGQFGLGVSPLYPTPITAIPEIRERFGTQAFPGAATAAERLVTFPVHRLVQPADYERILTVLPRSLGAGGRLQVITPETVVAHPAVSL
jgi:dTDP-4-amino-4,6-dideoxygalactose transaminase